MEQVPGNPAKQLEPFIGEWSMVADFPNAPTTDLRGRTVFEWMAGGHFLVQRWEVPHPAAPDGLAIIGFDPDRETYRQHYFDSRGVARVYEMTFDGVLWRLWRETADFSPLDFSQRFTGTFSDDQRSINGSWDTSDDGARWKHDFDLGYTKVAASGG
jgi:hypothetical protein